MSQDLRTQNQSLLKNPTYSIKDSEISGWSIRQMRDDQSIGDTTVFVDEDNISEIMSPTTLDDFSQVHVPAIDPLDVRY